MTLIEQFQTALRGSPDRRRYLAEIQSAMAKQLPQSVRRAEASAEGILVLVEYSPGSPSIEKRIWEFCESLHRALIVPLVLTDGAEGELYTKLFSFFPSQTAKRNTTSMMVDAGRMTGTEAFCIASDSPPPLYGLDSKSLHKQNAEAAELANSRSSALGELLQAAARVPSLPVTVMQALDALEPLCNLRLTHAQWNALRRKHSSPTAFLELLRPLLAHGSVSTDLKNRFGELLRAGFDFYECASRRSVLMPENAFRHIGVTGDLWAVVAVTGFHSEVVKRFFHDRNWAVYVRTVL